MSSLIFYLTQRKLGPPSESIGCPRKSTIIFFRPDNFILNEEKLDSYFTQLYTINMQLEIESLNNPDYQNIFRRLPTIKVSDFRRIIKTINARHYDSLDPRLNLICRFLLNSVVRSINE